MRRLTLVIIMLIVLSGCVDGERHEFSGSNKNWKISYVVEVSNGDSQETNGTIEYLGEEPIPETYDYELGTILTTFEGTGGLLTDGKSEFGNHKCAGCETFQEDDELEVEIMWDGQSERFVITTEGLQ